MLYQLYDLHHAAMTPMRLLAEATQVAFQNPLMPASYTNMGRTVAATAELVERTTRRYAKPVWGIDSTVIDGEKVSLQIDTPLKRPFCHLLHFKRATDRKDPKVLLVAPLSGHHATLLRGTVQALLPHHDVYVTDWLDARLVPLARGSFDLDDYIQQLIEFFNYLAPDLHVIAVCQPAVPVLAAVSVMAAAKDDNQPSSMTLMGGPIDARAAPTAVTKLAAEKPLSWFERTVVTQVPAYYPGGMRRVYPGFLQLSGFMSMNLDRHVGEHLKLFKHLIQGDGESADAHRTFYDEYLAVLDLPAEFYLQTVATVFQKYSLPKGEMYWRGELVDTKAIRRTALLTVEGELDDISAPRQTFAAHNLLKNLKADKKQHLLQPGVGHYGIFNGRKWRTQIMPVVRDFIRRQQPGLDPVPDADR